MKLQLLDYLSKHPDPDWLVGYNNQELKQLIVELLLNLSPAQSSPEKPRQILLVATDPLKFIASFLAAIASDANLFICNPHWQEYEWQQVFDLIQPDLILEEGKINSKSFLNSKKEKCRDSHDLLKVKKSQTISLLDYKLLKKYLLVANKNSQSLIMIPTGGSSGKIRFAIHNWSTLTASVAGFCHYFSQIKVNSCCLLPLYHVSGLMQLLRSFLTGGKLAIFPYQKIKQGEKPAINPQDFFVSLVPTQLQFLLQSDPDWLSNFKTVLLGGAPAWDSLLDTARKYRIALAPTYGMTETASQIVTLKPEDFLWGNNSSGQVLPHAQVTICNEKGNKVAPEKIGAIAIKTDSLCLGYYSQQVSVNQSDSFFTDDLGFFDKQGYLHIVGRNSQKIITGGENVFPAEVEAAILATNLVTDVAVIGLPNSHWGQVVTAVYAPVQKDVDINLIKKQIELKLSKYKLPKYWLEVKSLPRNERGKINYQELKKIVNNWLAQEKIN
jgi:O-succinylbenzoic acid--CoA ligase